MNPEPLTKAAPRRRVYISGPMTGLTRREYMRRFAVAEVALKRLGYEPVNPARFVVCKPWLFRLLGYRLTLIYVTHYIKEVPECITHTKTLSRS